jgi:hypothetical protein
VTDRYVKTVLTIIAAALVWLCVVLTPIGVTVGAQPSGTAGPPTRVVLVGWQDRDGFLHALSKQDGIPTLGAGPAASLLPPAAPASTVTPPPPASRGVVSTPAAQPHPGRCRATTQRGTQCMRTASAGSAYCWQHGR